MAKYSKAYGTLIGAIFGVLAVHGLVPDGLDQQVTSMISTAAPILTGILGTILAPKNKY